MRKLVLIITLVWFVSIAAFSVAAQTPAELDTQLQRHLRTMSENGSYGGNYNDEKLNEASAAFKQLLVKNAGRADILAYRFPRLNQEMYIATSPDGNLRVYSWDLQSGGTMHDHDMLIQFRGASGAVNFWTTGDVDEQGGGAFYTDVYQLKTPRGMIYLLASTAKASTSLYSQSISTVTVSGDTLEREAKLIKTSEGLAHSVGFAYDFFSVVDRPDRPVRLITFNPQRKTFSIPIVIEDEKTPQGRVTNKVIIYRFNGTHFVKVK